MFAALSANMQGVSVAEVCTVYGVALPKPGAYDPHAEHAHHAGMAEREGATGQLFSRTFRHAVEVGKRARSQTAIGRHPVSVSSAAVALAEERLGSLDPLLQDEVAGFLLPKYLDLTRP